MIEMLKKAKAAKADLGSAVELMLGNQGIGIPDDTVSRAVRQRDGQVKLLHASCNVLSGDGGGNPRDLNGLIADLLHKAESTAEPFGIRAEIADRVKLSTKLHNVILCFIKIFGRT